MTSRFPPQQQSKQPACTSCLPIPPQGLLAAHMLAFTQLSRWHWLWKMFKICWVGPRQLRGGYTEHVVPGASQGMRRACPEGWVHLAGCQNPGPLPLSLGDKGKMVRVKWTCKSRMLDVEPVRSHARCSEKWQSLPELQVGRNANSHWTSLTLV